MGAQKNSHWDGSFEYSQHMFCLRNKKIKYCYALLTKALYNQCFRKALAHPISWKENQEIILYLFKSEKVCYGIVSFLEVFVYFFDKIFVHL